MFPLSDNDMDQISREAAEQFQPEPTAAGWDALEKSLDQEMPTDQERKRRRLLWLLLPFLLIGTISAWWYRSAEHTEPGPLNTADVVEKAPATEEPKTGSLESNQADRPSLSSSSNATENTVPAPTPATKKQPISQANDRNDVVITDRQTRSDASNNNIAKDYQSVKKTGNKNNVLRPSLSNTDANIGVIVNNSSRRINHRSKTFNSATGSSLPAAAASEAGTAETTYKASLIGNPLALIQRPFKIEPRAIAPLFENKTAATPIKIPSKSNFKPGFSVSLVGGFDYSNIHGTKSNIAGFNSGILFQYDLNKRWSIVSGGIFTKKYYEALPQNFNPPKHYWTTYVTLHYVEGFCEMVDIPINIRYNAFAKNNTRLYASAGMSSYIMTHQNYDYYYTRAGQYTHKNWDTKSQSNYWFGVANLSAGIEQKIGNKFSVELEPYIKVPVSGVGFGQMDITSYGAMFHLKYQPRFK